MIESYVKEIEQKLELIKKENEEHINQLINIETSTEYGIGNMLVAYGRIYKVIFNATSYEDCVQKLEKLKKNDVLFDCDTFYDELNKIEDMIIDKMKKGLDFLTDTQLDVEMILEHEYILDTILKCL